MLIHKVDYYSIERPSSGGVCMVLHIHIQYYLVPRLFPIICGKGLGTRLLHAHEWDIDLVFRLAVMV